MAGVKDSPRQKMINMMYLVLTAMLALQVSNAILEKFQLLNNSLEQANSSAAKTNERTLAAMSEAVEKSGNKPEYVKLLKIAGDVRKQSDMINAYINDLKQQIIDEAGGGIDPETGNIKNLAEEEKVASLMVGPNKQGKGYELRDKLNAYINFLKPLAAKNTEVPSLALDAKDDPAMANTDATTRSKDFAELNFTQTPVPAALASLSQKQAEIRRVEAEILDYLAQQVGAKELKFDKIFAVVIPDSRSVVVGQKYKAEVAIGAYSSSITPRISINGSSIPVRDGKGLYEVTAQGGQFNSNGQLERSYTATLSFPKPDGSIETVTQQEKYTVLKPSIQLESATLPALYFKCANRLQTNSPGLGALYKPSFSGSGAEFIPGAGGKVTVVPNSSNVVLKVSNDGVVLQDFPFKVRLVPKPTIKIFANGGEISGDTERRGLAASSVRVIEARAIADEDFKNSNPEDAQYRVTGMTVSLARGQRRVDFVEGGAQVNISKLAQQAQAGDRYLIEVKGVERRNFKSEIENVSMGYISKTLQLN